MIMNILFGILLGFSMGKSIVYYSFVLTFLCFGLAFILMVVFHEAGHMVFGMLSGYKFSSFRIMNINLIKKGDKLEFSDFSLPGTLGQCILEPPMEYTEKFPYLLYNLGGVMMNLIVVIVSVYFYFKVPNPFLEGLILFNSYAMLTNGLPIKINQLNNDGTNALNCYKDEKARYAFWVTLRVNYEFSSGKRLVDLPENWFNIDNLEDTENEMVGSLLVYNCNYLLVNHDFENCYERAEKLLNKEKGILGLYKNLLINDCIYMDALKDDVDKAKEKYEKQVMFIRTMGGSPSVLRVQYAYALLVENDDKKAMEAFKKMIEIEQRYPYHGEWEDEMELMEVARRIKDEKANTVSDDDIVVSIMQ